MKPTECTGQWRDYHGPLEAELKEGSWLMQCDGCDEVWLLPQNITLIPGKETT